jgi:hypothetical protein
VCGDNATPNNTFCDHLYQQLLRDYDDNPTSNSGLPRCRFHGRRSRICCIAHIIALVVGAVLKSGTHAEAAELVAQANANGGVFDLSDCFALSAYEKIRAFVLWIQGSDDRRAEWRKYCNIMIPLDIDIRWNAFF